MGDKIGALATILSAIIAGAVAIIIKTERILWRVISGVIICIAIVIFVIYWLSPDTSSTPDDTTTAAVTTTANAPENIATEIATAEATTTTTITTTTGTSEIIAPESTTTAETTVIEKRTRWILNENRLWYIIISAIVCIAVYFLISRILRHVPKVRHVPEADEFIYGGTCRENVTWKLEEDGTLTISGEGAMENWEYGSYQEKAWHQYSDSIPVKKVVIKRNVTSIGKYAFSGCSSLSRITIPNSVTSIGYYAFYDCSSLSSITIPDSVTSIVNSAFSGCSSLSSITISDSVTSIGDFAFYGCNSLSSITIPDSVTSIGWGAFYGCSSLSRITIPDSVTSIGDDAFYGWTSSQTIYIEGNDIITSGWSEDWDYGCDAKILTTAIGRAYDEF